VILSNLISRLALLDLDQIGQAELAGQGQQLGDQIRSSLSAPPGGPHDHPWLQSGALRDSIGAEAEGDTAVVGSTSPIALLQEHGTVTMPPRPTFGPLAAEHGEAIAQTIAHALATAIRNA